MKHSIISTLSEDFERTENIQCRIMLVIIRLRFYVEKNIKTPPLKFILNIFVTLIYLIYCKLIHNCDISKQVEIGPGLRLVHPYNIIIADGVIIGKSCKLLHEVTIGYASRHGKTGVPTIKDNVDVNAGAKIVGPILVGNNVKIGANTVVYKDVPDDAVVFSSVEIRSP